MYSYVYVHVDDFSETMAMNVIPILLESESEGQDAVRQCIHELLKVLCKPPPLYRELL